jgi:hypothetical protein
LQESIQTLCWEKDRKGYVPQKCIESTLQVSVCICHIWHV